VDRDPGEPVDKATLSDLDRCRTPQGRLKGLVRTLTGQRELAAKYGCPFGTLACELDKRADGLDRTAAEVMGILVDWTEQQFRSMGSGDRADARDLAIALVASYQGISLLTNTFRDPELMVREGRRLERWIDSRQRGGAVVRAIAPVRWGRISISLTVTWRGRVTI
jgi:TetR/AcrR family transcriptional repressor of nem operon